MANRKLINTYLRMAWRANSSSNEARKAFLEEQLAARDEAVAAGDWEVRSTSYGGESQSSSRNIGSEERAEAIAEALEILTKNPRAKRVRGGVVATRNAKVPW